MSDKGNNWPMWAIKIYVRQSGKGSSMQGGCDLILSEW